MYRIYFSLPKQTMDIASHRQQVRHALRTLETTLARFVEALAHANTVVDVEPSTGRDAPIRRICEAYSQIDYRMADEPGASVVYLGVVGVSTEILRRAQAVNTAKAHLRAVCSPLQGISMRIPMKGESSPTKAIPVIRVILRSIQRSDLSLLAAYRKIPILGAPPATVTYTLANTRAVYRKSVDALLDLLSQSDSPSAAADRARLSSLDPREAHLALVKERYPNVRANVVYARLDARGRGRIQISAELPLLYANGRGIESPRVTFPPQETPIESHRARRSKLEPAPFLESIPVYRYRPSALASPR
jgi:hypothetical protein